MQLTVLTVVELLLLLVSDGHRDVVLLIGVKHSECWQLVHVRGAFALRDCANIQHALGGRLGEVNGERVVAIAVPAIGAVLEDSDGGQAST